MNRRKRVPAASNDPDALRHLLWPRPRGYDSGWVAVSDLPKQAARRLRLFGVACIRGLGDLLSDADRSDLLLSERYADGFVTYPELEAVSKQVVLQPGDLSQLISDSVGWAVLGYCGDHPATDPDNFHVWEPFRAIHRAAQVVAKATGRREAFCKARRQHVAILRDIAVNPSVVFDPAWRTSTAVAIAQGMYESRDFGAMPILADALQDAGCDDEAVLTHCRDVSLAHVRGCWVVDLVLGKG
jgi:hypothetical protein